MKKQKGITLIALIITIIVMIILVAVTVAVSLNGGLFNKAKEATLSTVIAELQEIVDMKKVEITAEIVSGKLDGQELDDEDISEALENPIMINQYALMKLAENEEYFDYQNFEDENDERTFKVKLRPEILENMGINTSYGKGEEDFVREEPSQYESETVINERLENDVFLVRLCDMKVLYRDKNGNIYPVVDALQHIKTDGNGMIVYFEYEDGLENITIPAEINGERITAIADYAFSGLDIKRNADGTMKLNNGSPEFVDPHNPLVNNKIKKVVIPDEIETIGVGAFSYCYSLEEVKLPSGLTRIEAGVFGACPNLKSIDILDSVTYIGDAAFASAGLTEVIIPNSVTHIGDSVFNMCKQLEKVVLSDSIEELPGGHEIGMFYGCDNLTEVHLPNNLKKIGEDTFDGCDSLKEITIPNSVTEINSGAFCIALEKIYFEPGANDIPDGQPWGATSAVVEVLPAE